VVAPLLALTLGAGTFASANYFQFNLRWIPLIGLSTPQTTPPCQGTGTVTVAWDPTAPGDPAGTPGGQGAFVITGVHVTTATTATTGNNPCIGHTADVVLIGSSAPYPVPDAAFGGPKTIDAAGNADWVIPGPPFVPYLPAGPFTAVIVSIS
jgi:hypothetical protein